MRLAEAIQRHKLNQEQEYAGNLLSYSLGGTGDFAYDSETGQLGYTPGGKMPSKTEAWNSYLQMKNGNITAQDMVKFEQLYTQAQGMQTRNQLDELSKLRLQGADEGDIQDLVKQNPQMYNNLLDMITQLESSPDPQGQNAMMASNMRAFLPQEEKSYLGQAWDMVSENPWKTGIGAAGALYGYRKLQDPKVQEWFRSYMKTPGAQANLDKLLKQVTPEGHTKYQVTKDGVLQERKYSSARVKNKDGSIRMKNGKPVMGPRTPYWSTIDPTKGGPKYKVTAGKTFSASQLKSARNILKYSGPQGLLQLVGYHVAPALAEKATGSKDAGTAVRKAFDLSFVASGGRMLMKVPGWQSKLIGAAMVLGGGAGLSGIIDE